MCTWFGLCTITNASERKRSSAYLIHPVDSSGSVLWTKVPARLDLLKSRRENPLTGQPARSGNQLRQTGGNRSRHGPSAQLTECNAACWVTPLPFSRSIAPIPALIFRSLRLCEKLHANREKKFMVVQNSFLYKHKTEWNFFTFAKRRGFDSRHYLVFRAK